MRHHIITIIMVGLLAVGCSGESGNGEADAKATTTAAEAAAESTEPAPVKLSTEWAPKLDAAANKTTSGICAQLGSTKCIEHLTNITSIVYDVETAIEEAGAETAYPRSMKHIDKVEAASEAFVAAECKGSTESMLDGTACAGYGGTLLMGASILSMKLQTDEYSAR